MILMTLIISAGSLINDLIMSFNNNVVRWRLSKDSRSP